MITEGIRLLLLAQPAVTQIARPQLLKSGQTLECVFNRTIPQGVVPPYVVIGKGGEFDAYGCMDGTYGLMSHQIEIVAVSRDEPEAAQLAFNIREFFKDYTGRAGPVDVIKAVNWVDDNEDEYSEGQGKDSYGYLKTNVFQVQHQPASYS